MRRLLLCCTLLAACGAAEPLAPELPVVAERRVVLIGDSITFGLGTPSNWFGPVAAEWQNAGRSGDWTTQVLQRLDSIDKAATTVVVLAGTNDIASGKESGAPANLTAIVAKIRAHGQRPVLSLVSPVTRGYAVNPSSFNTDVQKLNAWLRAYAAENGIPLADPYTYLADADGYGKPELYRADGLHLIEPGQAVLTNAYTKALRAARVIP